MGRSRYTITESDKPHFLTCTVVEWLPVFTRPETVAILLDCWRYQREHLGVRLYGFVVLENHCHFIAQAPDLRKSVSGFKSYTARQIIDLLQQQNVVSLLQLQHFAKLVDKQNQKFTITNIYYILIHNRL